MILIILTLSCFAFGSSYVTENRCYGKLFRLPTKYTPPLFKGRLYFTGSKKGESRRLVIGDLQIKDPRFNVNISSVTLTDLTEKDDGTFSVSVKGELHDVIRLKISDCAELVKRPFNGVFSHNVKEVEFVEFTDISRQDPTRVMWNRSSPRTNMGGRGQAKYDVWEIYSLTHADAGFYNFRKKDNTLKSRINLDIYAKTRYLNGDDVKASGGKVVLKYSWSNTRTIRFISKQSRQRLMLVKDGSPTGEDYSLNGDFMFDNMDLIRRITMISDGIEINRVVSKDSGTFDFLDKDGNVAYIVVLEVDEDEYLPPSIYVAIIASIILMVIVCCCIRKCCCKKRSAKRQSAPQTAAAPATYHHVAAQPTGPTYRPNSTAPPPPLYINPSLNPPRNQEPTTSVGPQVHNHLTPTQPEVGVPGGQGSAPAASVGSHCLSSDFVPKYELKGVTFPSAPPLSSDSPYCDVYTSDKLNFQ